VLKWFRIQGKPPFQASDRLPGLFLNLDAGKEAQSFNVVGSLGENQLSLFLRFIVCLPGAASGPL